jgi:peptidoglycan/xylan/chitin deacetylase (PgdA/CDA1 family)
MVGELLEHNPEMLDLIIGNGHEIGFHTMTHSILNNLSKEKFIQELDSFEKLTNGKSNGFRAPTFSLNYNTSWAIDALVKKNYLYDSSIVPVKTQLYGFSNSQKSPYKISSSSLTKNDPNGKLLEFPLAVGSFLTKKIPSGGFYLRSLPLKNSLLSIKDYEKQNLPATIYVHSWELTPEFIPAINLPLKENFITFYNIKKTFSKLETILKSFKFGSFANYIKTNF